MAKSSTPRQFLQDVVQKFIGKNSRSADLEAAVDAIMAPYYQRQREVAKHVQELEREHSEMKAQLVKLRNDGDRISELEKQYARMDAILRKHGIDPDRA